MKPLYEIDQAILDCVDLETGEILDPEKLDALQMERDYNGLEDYPHCECIYKFYM